MTNYPRGSPRYTVRLSMPEHEQLQNSLEKTGRDASSVIREALNHYLAFPEALLTRLTDYAAYIGVPPAEIITEAVRQHLKQYDTVKRAKKSR